MIKLASIGNPNSGKTTIFNALTGSHQHVGNWSGVTVEQKTGYFNLGIDEEVKIIDLPGIYSLDYDQDGSSIDERIAFDYVMKNKIDVIVNIIDASSMERSLYLTVQLKEMGLPVIVILNKMDQAEKKNIVIDLKKLSNSLKCPVFALSSRNKNDISKLKYELPDLIKRARSIQLDLDYGTDMEKLIATASDLLKDKVEPILQKSLAIKMLEKDQSILNLVSKGSQDLLSKENQEIDIDLQIADTRYTFIYETTQDAIRVKGHIGRAITDKIDSIVLNRFAGIPFFLFVMYLMFMFSINIGSSFIDFFDIISGAIFVDGTAYLLNYLSAPDWVVNVLANGVGSGIQTVFTFLPVIGCLYLFLALLEGSGYLSRAAFVVDRAMQYIGLPGKAFVPMIVGFGCTVPAVMAARTLDKERERLLTVVMSPFMSCGARLPVYALFGSAFFPNNAQDVVFILYLIGILVAVLTGFILSRTILPGKSENLFLELPDYEIPSVFNTLFKSWQKLKCFLFGAGKIIILVVAGLNIVNSIGVDGSFGHENTDQSVLSKGAQIITPILSPLGVTQDNWPATVGIVTGIFAKEAVVGTLNSLYVNSVKEKEGAISFSDTFKQALQTIPENLLGINFTDPLGIDLDPIDDLKEAALSQGVELSIYKNIQDSFKTTDAAFAYLLFILLYSPCAAAIGAIVREVGKSWAIFIEIWTTTIAYIVSVSYYQIATFSKDPITSSTYLLTFALIILTVLFILKRKGNILALDKNESLNEQYNLLPKRA